MASLWRMPLWRVDGIDVLILAYLAGRGSPQTARMIAEALGAPGRSVRAGLRRLMVNGLVAEARPGFYTVTEEGRRAVEWLGNLFRAALGKQSC